MKLGDSNDSKPETRSPLGIDLNVIPSSSFSETLPDFDSAEPDSFSIVRATHENLDPALGEPAGVPVGKEEEPCGACGASAAAGGGGRVVVCDGCERGFHLACARVSGRLSAAEEWVCEECVGGGVRSKRWPLGLKAKKRILDINASPPSDGDGDDEEMPELLRKHTPGDNSFVGNGFAAPLTYSNFLYAGNRFGFQKASGVVTHAVKVGFEDILHHSRNRDRSFDEVDLSFPLGRLRSSNNTAIRFPSRNPSDIFLHALREFVSERHGVLEEGWRVELKHSMSNCELYAVYCAPDGKTFDSVFDVACYLGLMSNYNSMDTEIKCEGASLQERLHLPRKRKSTIFSVANDFPENKESLISGYCKERSCDGQGTEKYANKYCIMKVTEAVQDEKDSSGSEQTNDGLPVQFEDFFVLSLGLVDMRPSYHDASLIFPIGYRSCWHDKITASLFVCEVLDGGDSGPIFKVRRYPCSALPLPIGSTVLFWPKIEQISSHNNEEGDATCYNNKEFDDDGSIQMILTDPCPPMENDILTCLASSLKETYVQNFDRSQPEAGSTCDKSGDLLMDEIGEISVEERSSSAAWRIISHKFIDACSEIIKRKGALEFFCKHAEKKMGSSSWDMMDEKDKEMYTPLAKFCGFLDSVSISFEYQADELETLADELTKWLGQDRFGLDAAFVQEIIEELPGVEACSQYESLKKRSSYSGSLTIRNGLLKINTQDGLECKGEKGLDGVFGKSKKPRLVDDHGPPSGKSLCLRLPRKLVGDFHQIWELLWRFREVMGLKEPFLANELEEQLANPWSNNSNLFHKFDSESQGTDVLSLSRIDGMGEQNVSPSGDSCMATSTGKPHSFIQMETGEMMEADQARFASLSYRRYFGVTLTKAHSSLLGVLISELQSKVAALDPNFDSGESRSKRGRKKDLDSTAPAKRVKLSVLPINELTWPELARRYILSVLSMDGNLESAEITARESGKVFRCLQGDGGVLCGSFTGVAGMEADALLLAEATKRIFGSLNIKSDVLTVEDDGPDENLACGKNVVNDGDIPEWAKLLEPVRKLPTNVGTRIRRCVYDALAKDPPEWAKIKLEHSISKEVYKGNASGPTKKAVLSVLADVHNECLAQKSEKGRSKKKIVLSVSDIIMKECRIILRRAAAADDSKIFCNLLGRKLMNPSDNDDEGLLGSPAMVSRPLDFRTIDLRLAVGAYGGSHEAFLEDVRELWSNVRTAFTDQPDLVELAESLSQNFESLYEQEVLTLVQKLVEYAKLECLKAETKKEINDILASTSEIPKAPWDEGVCKVCGIDKDDDSVLLCDTCDAEYHTYCLNPPLARIPEGNWYCPACVVSKRMVQDASECSQVIIRRRGKKYQGEVTRGYLEALAHLAAVMEEKEYWLFSMDERAFLLKFLCDELLNSALIHQHLEQCAETTAELHQKLRSAYVEWKNLKSREDFVAARAAKIDTNMINAVGDVGVQDGDDRLSSDGGKEGADLNGSNKYASGTHTEKSFTGNCQFLNPMDAEARLKGDHAIVDASKVSSQKSDKSFRPSELPVSNHLPQEIDDSRKETNFQSKLEESKKMDGASLPPPSDCNGQCLPSYVTSLHAAKQAPSVAENESQSHHLELNTIKSDIQQLQDLITSLESQLLKLSVRKEFLGSDSSGRLYWISAMPGAHPQVIVDGSSVLQKRRNFLGYEDQVPNTSVNWNFTSPSTDTGTKAEGSKASCSFVYNSKEAMSVGSPWVTYQSDAEIGGLIDWLNDNDPNEKELKEAIRQKLKFQDYQKMKKQVQDECQTACSMSNGSDKASFSSFLVTKAATLLEKKYGPCFESEIIDSSKKRGKKAKVIIEDKMYRCKCLEPVWPSRIHCISCHRTFFSDVEFEDHSDGRCNLGPPAREKGKSVGDSLKGKGNMKFDINRVDCTVDMEIVETSKSEHSKLSSRLIKFQNEGVVCPYDFEEISSKFVTRDSNEELVREIGLIGSNGVPSFVSSVTHFVSDSTLIVPLQQEVGDLQDELKATVRPGLSQGNRSVANGVNEVLSDNSFSRSVANEIEVQKTKRPALRCLEQRDRTSSSDKYSPELGIGRCCVVPQSSLRPLVGKVSQILRQLKINLLDMDAALSEEALRPSKACMERRWAWRLFVKSAETIYEMVQATIVLEDMIKAEYLRNEWWYWSSLSAAAKVSTISSLALRIYSLDAAIVYEKSFEFHSIDNLKPSSIPDPKLLPNLDLPEKCKVFRKTSKKRKQPDC